MTQPEANPQIVNPDNQLTHEQFIADLAEIFDVLARWDYEEKQKSKPADKGHQVINLALPKQ